MLPLTSYAQDNFPINGVRSTNQITYAFINADIYIDYNKIISNATLLIKNDRILKVGSNIKIPNDAKIIDLNGYKICPSFIDIYTDYGQKTNFSDIELSSWNSALNTEFNAINNFEIDLNKAESFIKNGFGIVNSLNKDGIIRGSSTLVSLSYDKPHSSVIIDQSALCLSFNKGASKTKYPSSLMGSIALIRQAYYDADWYDGQKHIYNNSLRAFNIKRDLPKIFEVSNYQSIFRANKIANEFKEKYIIKTNGDEYKRVEELKNLDIPLIVPINFDKLKINTDPYENLNISLASLKHAETAPYNFSILVNHGIDVALTLDGLDSFSDFYKNLKTIISTGVNKNEILKSLTYNPANFLNVYNQTGIKV